jgi:DNA-binding response OmpR family regulator
MSDTKILLIESSRASAHSFSSSLERKGYSVEVHNRLPKALDAAEKDPPDLVILDAASMRTTGTRLCRRARARLDSIPIILITLEGARPDPGNGASLTLVHPFTARKLLNRVARLIPVDENYVIEVGPLKLNLAQRKVKSMGRESRITPKQVQLLHEFMKNPGRLLSRETLIRKVWQTDYTGDTRTLDVHMSWLRKAIEPNPNQPQFIKTIRGMGYRFDPPEQS